jgi:hypothetical protein
MKDFATEDDDTDEDDIVAKAENKEEKIDTDKFNYDALAAFRFFFESKYPGFSP